MELKLTNSRKIQFIEGDITTVPVDAIANAANSSLAGGGGVDGAIHRAGGPEIMDELDVIRKAEGGCPTGSAVATIAGDLPAKWVLHAVGPIYRDGQHGEPARLASAYRRCLELAADRGAESISFPAISTGVYGYPLQAAAEIAVRTVHDYLLTADTSIRLAVFVLFGAKAHRAFTRAAEEFA